MGGSHSRLAGAGEGGRGEGAPPTCRQGDGGQAGFKEGYESPLQPGGGGRRGRRGYRVPLQLNASDE